VGPNNGADTNGVLLTGGTAGDCVPGGSSDLCNTVNNGTIKSPWAYQSKISGSPANTIYAGGAMEGGADLTALHLTGCFSTFLAETRSSPEVGAQLKDFLIGKFESCGTSVKTTPADGSGTALTDLSDPADGVLDAQLGTGSAGVDVTDNASVTVNGLDTWTGTVAFHICGPIASGTCGTGGVSAGTKNVSNSQTTATSYSVNLTEVGRYCWRGDFTPSAQSTTDGLKPASDSSTGECFDVLPVTPALDTQAVDANGADQTAAVPFGQPVYDKASLTDTANEPGDNGGSDPGQLDNTYASINATNGLGADGQITFELKGPDGDTADCSTTATGTGDNPQTVDVLGDDDYFSAGFTPDSPGVYHWVASYGGSTSGNTLGTDHNTDCLDTGEDVTVEQIPTSISTRQRVYPNDAAQIASTKTGDNLPAGGTVTFKLYDSLADCQLHGATGLLYSETKTVIGGAHSENLSTSNTTVPVAFDATVYWWVMYDTGDSAHTGRQSDCAENVDMAFTNDAGPGTLFTPSP
jgi:hypothetical protein